MTADLSDDADGRHDFDAAFRPFWAAMENFVEAARVAHQQE